MENGTYLAGDVRNSEYVQYLQGGEERGDKNSPRDKLGMIFALSLWTKLAPVKSEAGILLPQV